MAERSTGRRKVIALFLSGIFPGLGQLYNRQFIKAVMFLVGGLVLSWLLGRAAPSDLVALLSAPPGSTLIIPLCLLLAIWIWSLIDAWWVAGR
jgi:hypothetical protein